MSHRRILRRTTISACLIGSAVLMGAAHAQQQIVTVYDGAPPQARIHDIGGGVGLSATLEGGGTWTDNFYNQPEESQEVSGFLFRPNFNLGRDNGRFSFALNAGGEYAQFDAVGNKDDYFDGVVGLAMALNVGTRHRFSLSGGFQHDHDPFGTNRTEGAPTAIRDRDIDEWERQVVEGRYRYGAAGATANAELRVAAGEKQYTTNEADTGFLDFSFTEIEYTLFYNFTPRTSAIFNIVRDDAEFDIDPTPLGVVRDGEALRVRGGLRWVATAKTTGDVRIGYMNREYDGGPREAFEAVDWLAVVTWAPRGRTGFSFDSGRISQESYRTDANFIDNQFVGVTWKEAWTARLRTELRVNYTESEFVGSGRTDRLPGGSFDVEYLLARQLALLGSVSYNKRDADDVAVAGVIPDLDFDKTSVYLGLRYQP